MEVKTVVSRAGLGKINISYFVTEVTPCCNLKVPKFSLCLQSGSLQIGA